MPRYDVIQLITENAAAHGVHQAITEEAREVYAEIRSVKRQEYYAALNDGITPEIVFYLEVAEDYQGERYIRYNGIKYQVGRTYVIHDGIELTCQRSDENA